MYGSLLTEVPDALRRLRWARVIPAAAATALLTVAFVYLAVFAFVVSYTAVAGEDPSRERLDLLVGLVGNWGARLFFLLAVALTSAWAVRRAGELALPHGLAVGLCAALAQQGMVYLLTPSVEPGEFAWYLLLGALGGWLGAAEGRGALADQEEVYRASKGIGDARDAADVATAIGEHLGGGTVGVSLWGIPPGDGNPRTGELEHLASWTPDSFVARGPRTSEVGPPVARAGDRGPLDPRVEAELRRRSWSLAKTDDLPEGQSAGLVARSARSVLVISLDRRDGQRHGLLVAAFTRSRPSRGVVRQYLTVGTQAALALEYLGLAEEFRLAGRRAGVMRERQRLSHEIHDTLAQGFTSVVSNLAAAEAIRAARERDGGADARELAHLEHARAIARESLAEARRLVWALRPESLDRHPLPQAIGRLARSWSEETGVEARFETTGERVALRPEAEVALLRTAQEGLANARKHAEAGRVRLTLSYMEDIVVLDIADDGRGFNASGLGGVVGSEDRGGFGLTAMRERVEALGGAMLVESEPSRGTIVAVELPFEQEDEARMLRADAGGGAERGVPEGTP